MWKILCYDWKIFDGRVSLPYEEMCLKILNLFIESSSQHKKAFASKIDN